jgi:uncharacterized protein YndB with AHSA1/START domain
MSVQAVTSLRLTRVVKADPARVFRAWTDPEQLVEWACPEGLSVENAEVDLRVGGRYRIVMRAPDGAVHTAAGVYREIERPGRLVYTWTWEGTVDEGMRIGETVVTVEFRGRGDGTSDVVLMHEGFPGAEARDNHEAGWTSCVNRLEMLLA